MKTDNPQNANPESRWFGTRQVDPAEKTGLVREVFDSVASRYDLMNDLMSAGIHRAWKDTLVRMIRPRPDQRFLDLAGGTGDIAFRLHRASRRRGDITVCDINLSMLDCGRDRALDRGIPEKTAGAGQGLAWVTGNAESLPFPDAHFDVCTIAFGLRNVTRIDDALGEIRRVLRPGGRFYCLEFSRVGPPGLARLYDAYSDLAIPLLGKMIANDADSYRYLVQSIRSFPDQEALAARMEKAGFQRVRYRNLSFGVACIHSGLAA